MKGLINEFIWSRSKKFTHPSTGMEYIKFNKDFYFKTVKFGRFSSEKVIYRKSGALGGFTNLDGSKVTNWAE